MNPVIYVFVNKSLGMSAGKLAAQAAHAVVISAMQSGDKNLKWALAVHKTILVMEGRDEAHLRNLSKYLEDRKIDNYSVIDEGTNEIDPHTITALATVILDKDDEEVQKAMSTFRLYRDSVKVTLEIEK